MQREMKWCYLCRSTENLTRDHLPPKNLFPEPRPSNLITVPCCKTCNERFSKLDEQVRVFMCMPVNVSEAGKNVMRQKVFGGSLKKSPALRKQMARGLVKKTLVTQHGPVIVPLITMGRVVLDPFFTRLTKGLLATFYPDVDYFGQEFDVTQPNQFTSQHPRFKAVTSTLTADERGDGVFRFWHRVAREERNAGMWIYQFYDAAMFIVRHREAILDEGIIKIASPC